MMFVISMEPPFPLRRLGCERRRPAKETAQFGQSPADRRSTNKPLIHTRKVRAVSTTEKGVTLDTRSACDTRRSRQRRRSDNGLSAVQLARTQADQCVGRAN